MLKWVRELGHVLLAPEWFAGLLQSGVGAILGVLGALWVLRRQFSQDRQLVRQQIEAETRRKSVNNLGTVLLEALGEVESLADEALMSDLGQPSVPESLHRMDTALSQARLRVDLDQTCAVLVHELEERWRTVSRQVAGGVRSPDGQIELDPESVSDGLIEVLSPACAELRQVAEAYVRWNGLDRLPGREAIRTVQGRDPVPDEFHSVVSSLFDNGPDRYEEWCADVRAEFRTAAWRHYRSNRRAAGLRRLNQPAEPDLDASSQEG